MVRQRGKKTNTAPKGNEQLAIPEDEQWRLINDSGILKKIEADSPKLSTEEPDEVPGPLDEILDAVLLIIPFSFLLLMMDILIHYQYGKEIRSQELGGRMLTRVPILSVFIFYTARYKKHRRMQILLFALAVLAGCRMLFIINRTSWVVNMRQCPPLATLWIYAIVQLELGPATMSLVVVTGFIWLKNLLHNNMFAQEHAIAGTAIVKHPAINKI